MGGFSTCRACGAQIRWITSKNGKHIPCDFSLTGYINAGHGRQRIVTESGDVISCELTDSRTCAEGYGYIPHWSTCTKPDQFRRR